MIYRFDEISIKIIVNYFVAIDKLILKFMWRIANTILKNKVGGLTLPYFKTFYKLTIITTVWYGTCKRIDKHINGEG
jgi:hypothetical protein